MLCHGEVRVLLIYLRVRVTYLNNLIHLDVRRLIHYCKDAGQRDRRLGFCFRYLLSHWGYFSFPPWRRLNPFDLGFLGLGFLRFLCLLMLAFGLLGHGGDGTVDRFFGIATKPTVTTLATFQTD